MAVAVAQKWMSLGRKPSDNPLVTLITFRIDEAMTKRLDSELEDERAERPGLLIGRGDIVRMLLVEALDARKTKRKRK